MKKTVLWVASTLLVIALVILFIFLPKPENRIFTENDAQGTIKIEVGEAFIIELDENPSTGYSWHYLIEPEGSINLDSEQHIADDTKNLIGAPGKHEFVFKTNTAGNTQIAFDYYRPWEPEDVENTLIFNFAVQ